MWQPVRRHRALLRSSGDLATPSSTPTTANLHPDPNPNPDPHPKQVTYAFEHPHHRHVEMQMRYVDMVRPRLTAASSPGGVELQFRAATCPTRGPPRAAERAACPAYLTLPLPYPACIPRPRFPRRSGRSPGGQSAAPLLCVRPGVRLTPVVWPGGASAGSACAAAQAHFSTRRYRPASRILHARV